MIVDSLNEAPAPFKGTEIHTLRNGLKLILKEDHTAPVVSMQAWARCGAVNETPEMAGISHVLEHMVFKGTQSRSAGEIARIIESYGGNMNAATQLETTHYYIDVPSCSADPALDVLMDTLLHPQFPQEELERERLVILEEIHRRGDSPDATLWDEFSTSVFRNSPYGVNVIGSEKTVSAMTRDDLTRYYQARYVPPNLCVVIAGDFEKSHMFRKIMHQVDNMKGEKTPDIPEMDFKNWTPEKNSIKKPVQMVHMAVGIPTAGLGGKDLVALDILADILGGSASSRLYQKLREETQNALSVSCDYIAFVKKGLFGFFLDTLPPKADKALDQLFVEIRKVKENPIRQPELDRAKARTKSDWLVGAETPRGQASALGSLCLQNHMELITQYLSRVEALTIDDLMKAYEEYLENQRFAVTRVVPES